MTTAAAEFLASVSQSWDSITPFANTAADGLEDTVDAPALRAMCERCGDDYDTAEAEVLAYCREKVSR